MVFSMLRVLIVAPEACYLPPAIVVFASTAGGPYVDAECADTFDGKEWFNRYMATDVVEWADSKLADAEDLGPGPARNFVVEVVNTQLERHHNDFDDLEPLRMHVETLQEGT